jgi:hypothetical protein
MAGEDRLRKYVLDNVDRFGHWFRVESHEVSPGVPDLHVTIGGISRWIELKYGTRNKPPQFRPTQYAWMKREVGAGGKPLTLVCIHENVPVFAVVSGHRALAIHRETARSPSIIPWTRAGHSTRIWRKAINWDEFLKIVLDPTQLEEPTNG